MTRWDVILVGAGLANGLIALRLSQRQPALNILMIESGSTPGGNHTWSFHHSDLTAGQHSWIAPLVSHRWQGYDVQFPDVTRTLPGDYLTVTAERFATLIGQLPGVTLLTDSRVTQIAMHHVCLDGGRTFSAPVVIDGRGYQPVPGLTVGWQSFLGQQWQLTRPHGLIRPLLMDATVDQLAGYRFVYLLPFSADSLLIEDTHYIDDRQFDAAAARARIAAYAAEKGWQLQTLQREERGSLPIILTGPGDIWQQGGPPCSGLRAGLCHPTTGYSLPLAATLAELIAGQTTLDSTRLLPVIRRFAAHQWRRQRFFRLLNRMLFLAGPPAQRWRVMQRFYRLDDSLIARFYAGQPTAIDMARILTGKPPVPVGEALRAVLKLTPRL